VKIQFLMWLLVLVTSLIRFRDFHRYTTPQGFGYKRRMWLNASLVFIGSVMVFLSVWSIIAVWSVQ
jgi:hypothetical protein